MKSELVENRIIVWDIEDSKKLFSEGYYGKPIGMPKPKIEEIDVPLPSGKLCPLGYFSHPGHLILHILCFPFES